MIPFLNLGRQPIANGFRRSDDISKEYFFDLITGFDEKTKLVSIINPPDKSVLFNESYIYRSSGSSTMRAHFKKTAEDLKKKCEAHPGSKVLEIGSNDGVMVSHLDPRQTICIEPCANMASITRNMGYETHCVFWNKDIAQAILDVHGPIQYIYAANCMCHILEIQEAFEAIELLLDKDGIFIFEDPSMEMMFQNTSYDQIYDEHAHIFSIEAIHTLLNNVGLYIQEVKPLEVHGGSNRFIVSKQKSRYPILYHKFDIDQLKQWSLGVQRSKYQLLATLYEVKKAAGRIAAIGATSKSTVIYNYCGIDSNLIEFISDTTLEKQGLVSPGKHIPVVSPDRLKEVDTAFLGAWNFSEEIKSKHPNIKLITHVPRIRII